tara:strand:+ start:777 stop:968 length:192 start_codon:yes stop_codon:yes gene_type:complete
MIAINFKKLLKFLILNKQKNLKSFEKIFNRKFDCSVNKASNEIMLNRISGGKDIEFPFCSLKK